MPTRKQLEELIKSDPDDVFLQYALAKACLSEGDTASGIRQFQDVVGRYPDYVPAYFQQGQALADCGRIDEARTIISRGIEVARKTGDRHAEREMTEFLEALSES